MNPVTLPCPLCAEKEAGVSLQLHDGEFCCAECGEVFTREDVESAIAFRKWLPVLKWIDAFPADAIEAAEAEEATA